MSIVSFIQVSLKLQNCINLFYSFIYKMLIQLQIESLIKQIERDSIRTDKLQKGISNQSTTSSESDDDNKSTTSSFLQRTKNHIQSSQQLIKVISTKTQRQINKLSGICSDTFLSDKIIRLIGSLIKILRVFKIIENTKPFGKLSIEIIQSRRLLRYNRFLSYMHQIRKLITKPSKKWLDYYNILFKHLQLAVDINDTLGYFQQMNLIPKTTFNNQALKKNVSNLYFFQCLMWLYLNIYDYLKSRKHRTKTQNLRKQLTIAKYALDSFTSHNQFSRRLYTINPKVNTIVGFVSSVVGLVVLWV